MSTFIPESLFFCECMHETNSIKWMNERTNEGIHSFVRSFVRSFMTVLHSHHIGKSFCFEAWSSLSSVHLLKRLLWILHTIYVYIIQNNISYVKIFSGKTKKQKCQINLLIFSKTLPGRFKQENSGILKTVKTCNQTHLELSSLQLNIPWSRKGKSTTKSLRCFKNRITYKW